MLSLNGYYGTTLSLTASRTKDIKTRIVDEEHALKVARDRIAVDHAVERNLLKAKKKKNRNGPPSLPQRPKRTHYQPKKKEVVSPQRLVMTRFLRHGGANDFAPSIASGIAVDGYDAGKELLRCFADPVGTPEGLVHLLDPYTTIACESSKFLSSVNMTIFNGSTGPDGSLMFMLRGDTLHTITLPATIDAAHNVTWAGFTSLNTYAPYNNGWYTRPMNTFVRLSVYQTGDPHVVTLHTYRAPAAVVATQVAAAPVATNVGTTAMHRESFQGSDTEVMPDAQIDFSSHVGKGTADATAWNQVNADRGAIACTGHYVWLFGLRASDRVEMTYGSFAEYYPITTLQALNTTPSAVTCTPMCSELVTGAADVISTVGADVIIDNSDDQKKKSTVEKVVSKINALGVADTVENGLSVITDIVAGDFWGAIKGGYNLIRKLFAVNLYRPQRLRTAEGFVNCPPILPRDPQLLPRGLQQIQAMNTPQSQHTSPQTSSNSSTMDGFEVVRCVKRQ